MKRAFVLLQILKDRCTPKRIPEICFQGKVNFGGKKKKKNNNTTIAYEHKLHQRITNSPHEGLVAFSTIISFREYIFIHKAKALLR